MRQSKPGDSRCDYTRDVYPNRRHDGLTVTQIQAAQAAKLTELNDRNVRLGGLALALGDPRVIAGQVERLAQTVRAGVLLEGDTVHELADALAAQVIALRLSLARVEALRIDTGDAA